MKTEEFEKLLTEAELHPIKASESYGVAFSVSLHVPTTFGIRHQTDWLTYEPSAFSAMTLQAAQKQIAMIIASLAKAAKTKQATLAGGRENR